MARVLQLILLLLLAFIAWRLIRQWLARFLTPPEPPEPSNDARFEPTARCAGCGTHVPRSELDDGGRCARCRNPGT